MYSPSNNGTVLKLDGDEEIEYWGAGILCISAILEDSNILQSRSNPMFGIQLDSVSHFETDTEQAESSGIVDRLVNEVKGMENLPEPAYSGGSSVNKPYATALMSGEEEMLTTYAGWYVKSRMWWDEQNRQFESSYEQGDLSLKEASTPLIPVVEVEDGRLVDKDGDTVQRREDMHISMVTP